MDFHKESTYNPKKYTTGCPGCFAATYSCPKCQGPCFFSRINFKENETHIKEFRKKLRDKYYKEDFETLREFIRNETIKNNSEEQEEIEDLDEYELLEMVHSNPKLYMGGLGKHVTEYNVPLFDRRGFSVETKNTKSWTRASNFLNGAKMTQPCFRHRTKENDGHTHYWKYEKPTPRHEKKSKLVKGNKDFVMINDSD
jgi:hypothetical protein